MQSPMDPSPLAIPTLTTSSHFHHRHHISGAGVGTAAPWSWPCPSLRKKLVRIPSCPECRKEPERPSDAGREFGIQVTLARKMRPWGQKPLTPLICSKVGCGDIRMAISDHECHEYRWKNKFPVSAGWEACQAWLPRMHGCIQNSDRTCWLLTHCQLFEKTNILVGLSLFTRFLFVYPDGKIHTDKENITGGGKRVSSENNR